MTVQLDHTIVSAHNKDRAATFLTEILGLPPPRRLGHFTVVQIGVTSIDFVSKSGDIQQRHFAFLVSEGEFDEIFDRIRARKLPYWSDPRRRHPGEVNVWDDGRGVYFDDPDGHLLEIITRRYGSAGTETEHPHPLIAPIVELDSPTPSDTQV